MTNDYIAVEIANEVEKAMLSEGANSAYAKSCALLAQKAAMDMAYRKDSQPQIIELFGKRVKVVNDIYSSAESCKACALLEPCYSPNYALCQTADEKFNRHFVEVDEDGNEI